MSKIFKTLTVALIAFVFSFLGYTLTHASLPSSDSPIKLYATETHHDLQITFTQAIEEAKTSIHLTIYSLRDKKVINSLRRAAARGVDIQIICDRNASSHLASKIGKNVHVFYHNDKGLMHQKILIVDQHTILCGSANLTTASLKMHGNLVTGIYSPKLAAHLLIKFNTMKKEGRVEKAPQFNTVINGQNLEFWFLPDHPEGVEKIKQLIRSAEKSIRIAMFTWTRYDLADAVIAAKKRGVHVEVVLDRNASSGVSKRIAEKLLKGGIPVKVNQGPELLHHKFLLIDHQTLLNGSANWTKAAFTINDDFFMIITPLKPSQQKVLEEMWDEILLHSTNLSV